MANKKNKSGKNKPASKPAVKVRGGLLSTLIILIFVHSALAVYLGVITLKQEYAQTPWALPLLTVVALAGVVAAIGLWFWKQWAITLYAVVCIIQASVHLAMTGSLLVVFYDILPLSILGYVINLQSKRKLFG